MIPSEIRANFDLDFSIENAAQNVPTGYTPKFVLGGASSFVKDGAIDGQNVKFSLVPADTADLATGQYWAQAVAENGTGGRTFLAEGSVWILGKITGDGVYDGRSVAERILEAIDAAMLGKATKDQQSYVIQSGSGSRSLSRLDVADLMEARKLYAGIVQSEKAKANGNSIFKRHKFGFVAD